MVFPMDSPHFSELLRIQQRIQDYSYSFQDFENPKALMCQNLSARAGELATRDGAEIRVQDVLIHVHTELVGDLNNLVQALADKIQGQDKKTRAQSDWIQAQVVLTHARAELIRAQAEAELIRAQAEAELIRAQAEAELIRAQAEAELTRAKEKNQNKDETRKDSPARPRKGCWEKICNFFKRLQEICTTLFEKIFKYFKAQ